MSHFFKVNRDKLSRHQIERSASYNMFISIKSLNGSGIAFSLNMKIAIFDSHKFERQYFK